MVLAASVVGGVSAQAPSAGGPAAGGEPQSIRITPENALFSKYLRELAGPRALAGLVVGGVLGQLRGHNDHELPGRIAEGATQHAVQVSVLYGLAALMHRSTDQHFHFCECHGFGPRVQHALLESFTDRLADGSRALSIPHIAGSYAGAFADLPFQHDRRVGNVAIGTTLSLGSSALFNIARELTGLGRHRRGAGHAVVPAP
jgi:hypothetical protein